MTGYTAVKAKYNRRTKGYGVEVVENADTTMIHGGWFVFESADPAGAIKFITEGPFRSGWDKRPEHRDAVVCYLRNLNALLVK